MCSGPGTSQKSSWKSKETRDKWLPGWASHGNSKENGPESNSSKIINKGGTGSGLDEVEEEEDDIEKVLLSSGCKISFLNYHFSYACNENVPTIE